MEKKRILIVDDEANFGKMLKINLEKTGSYEVDQVEDGLEGLKEIEKKAYDYIFLDVLMPKMEGGEVLQKIRQVTSTPVVVMSAYLPAFKRKRVLEAGAFECLQKPFGLEKVLEIIHKIAAHQENERVK
jgi:DNA-binding response OmpR family regulator